MNRAERRDIPPLTKYVQETWETMLAPNDHKIILEISDIHSNHQPMSKKLQHIRRHTSMTQRRQVSGHSARYETRPEDGAEGIG